MKSLTLLDENHATFKLDDTGTILQFSASDEGQPVGITKNQSAVFRIKNEFGFVKFVNAQTNYGGYVFELDTSNLTDLVPDTYSVELLVKLDSDNELIFPDEGFVQFTITPNALNITGEQLPMMSLDSFKNELKTYVDNETAELKNDFDTYVASVKTGPQGEPGKDGTNGADGATGPQGEAATVNIGTVSTLSNGQSAYVNNTGSNTNAVFNFGIPQGPQGPTGEKGEKGDTGDVTAYCNSTGWLQTGLQWDSHASNIKAQYKIDSINGSSLLYFFCSAYFPKDYLNAWGKVIFTFPDNVTINNSSNFFVTYVSTYGYGNLKIRNNQMILNQFENIGNADSNELIELNFWGYIPVTMSN